MSSRKIGVVIHTELRDRIFLPEDLERLDSLGEVRWTDSSKPISTGEAIELLAGCEVGVGSWGTPKPDAELTPACPELKLWVHAAGTVKGHFGEHLAGRDLKLATCKKAIADSVANMTVAEILFGLRRILANAQANRTRRGVKPGKYTCLCEATVGVVGASDVGRRVIELLRTMGCREILVYDPYLGDAEAAEMGVTKLADLVALCSRSHAVTLHAPALPATEKMMGAEQFAAMPDDGVFVNTARGMCVDEHALIAELSKGRLVAFLDVTDPEPAVEGSPLRTLPNVVYTSHIAGGPGPNIGRQAVDDVAAYLRGEQPTCVVTPDMLERLA
jgi:phosphoglycerate dehydrogenase-like enzyme